MIKAEFIKNAVSSFQRINQAEISILLVTRYLTQKIGTFFQSLRISFLKANERIPINLTHEKRLFCSKETRYSQVKFDQTEILQHQSQKVVVSLRW